MGKVKQSAFHCCSYHIWWELNKTVGWHCLQFQFSRGPICKCAISNLCLCATPQLCLISPAISVCVLILKMCCGMTRHLAVAQFSSLRLHKKVGYFIAFANKRTHIYDFQNRFVPFLKLKCLDVCFDMFMYCEFSQMFPIDELSKMGINWLDAC